jgi:protein phosphatase
MGAVDTWVFPPHPGEVFVICSDGLTNELTREQIEAVLAEHPDADEAAAELVRRAVEAGGHDNVTAIVVAVRGQESDSDADEDTTLRGNVKGSSGESRS